MKGIFEILKDAGIELDDDKRVSFEKEFCSNYKTIAEFAKKTEKLQAYEEQLATMTAQIDDLKKVDIESIKNLADEWKTKAETIEKESAEKERRWMYEDALRNHTSSIKFTSESARKAFVSDAIAKQMDVKDGKLNGFDDFLKGYKDTDAAAFAAENETEAPKIVTDKGAQPNPGGGNPLFDKMRQAAGLKQKE